MTQARLDVEGRADGMGPIETDVFSFSTTRTRGRPLRTEPASAACSAAAFACVVRMIRAPL